MFVVVVTFRVAESFAEEFRELVLRQAANSLSREPGCHRFDVAISADEPTSCLLYELYDDRAAFDAHVETSHFKEFSAAVEAGVVSKDVTFWDLAS